MLDLVFVIYRIESNRIELEASIKFRLIDLELIDDGFIMRVYIYFSVCSEFELKNKIKNKIKRQSKHSKKSKIDFYST